MLVSCFGRSRGAQRPFLVRASVCQAAKLHVSFSFVLVRAGAAGLHAPRCFQIGQHVWGQAWQSRPFVFSVARQTALPIRIVLRLCAGGGGAVDSKSCHLVVEIYDAAMIWTLASPVVANQLAAGAFCSSMKMTTQDFTSPVADRYLAAGAFFCETDHPWI